MVLRLSFVTIFTFHCDMLLVLMLTGVSYPFNDGAVIDLEMYDEDALRCVYVDPRDIDVSKGKRS